MARTKTFVNGGSLLPSDLNAISDDYETAFGGYKHLLDKSMRLDAPTSAGPYLLVDGYSGAGNAAAGAQSGMAVFYLDPALYTALTRTTYYNLRVGLVTNATAIGTVTLTTGLYTVTASAGAAATVSVTTSASAITGSTVVSTNPGASVQLYSSSGDFAAPAAGHLALAMVVSANAAASSSFAVHAKLQMRQV